MMNGSEKEIREMSARICRDYLTGSWKDVTGSDIGLSQVMGGLSNKLYQVSLPASLPPRHAEPLHVLLRLYGQIRSERPLEELINEAVTFALLAERKLGPALHGLFPGGRIEEYINARPLEADELSDPKLSSIIASKMATIHSMDVPITKEPTWVWDTMQRFVQAALESLGSPGQVAPEYQAAMAQLQTYDLAAEAAWIKQQVCKGDYPVTFCHNDLTEGNILLPLDLQPGEDPSLVLIDFEWCCYNYRGFDVANHLIEWMYDYKNEKPPFFNIDRRRYPSLEQKLVFIRSYLDTRCQMGLLRQEDVEREEATLLREVEVFTMVSHLLWGCWSVVNAKMCDVQFGSWAYAAERLDSYMTIKRSATCFNDLSNPKTHNGKLTHDS